MEGGTDVSSFFAAERDKRGDAMSFKPTPGLIRLRDMRVMAGYDPCLKCSGFGVVGEKSLCPRCQGKGEEPARRVDPTPSGAARCLNCNAWRAIGSECVSCQVSMEMRDK
jgi:DnaJ-class molecular chaperone